MDLLSPVLNGVDFRANRSKVGIWTAGKLGLAAALMYAALTRAAPLASPGEITAALFASGGAALLAGTALLNMLRHFTWGDAVVTIDERGILDRRVSPYVLPWSHIRDVRFLDRRGHRVGIELDSRMLMAPRRRSSRLNSVLAAQPEERMAVIDTFFLHSASGNRLLDFLLPITAMAPLDVSDTAVNETTLRADAREVRRHRLRFAAFGLISALLPTIAATYLVVV